MTRLAALCLAALVGFAPALAAQGAVSVFAAASLRGVLEDLAGGTGIPMRLSLGGSGTIARQVAAGAPADVVVLASPEWMAWLADQGVLADRTPVAVAGNRLVLVAQAGAAPLASLAELPDRLGPDRLAMGHRSAVPAGQYAVEWLRGAGLWDSLQDRLAETDNVRAALALVARGQAPLGIVYASDAQAESAVAVLLEAPADSHAPILYPAVALTPAGEKILALLLSPPGAAAFARHGFTPAPR